MPSSKVIVADRYRRGTKSKQVTPKSCNSTCARRLLDQAYPPSIVELHRAKHRRSDFFAQTGCCKTPDHFRQTPHPRSPLAACVLKFLTGAYQYLLDWHLNYYRRAYGITSVTRNQPAARRLGSACHPDAQPKSRSASCSNNNRTGVGTSTRTPSKLQR